MVPPLNLLATRNGRTVIFTALYMSEGAPIGFLWWALPTILRSHHLPLQEITSLSALLTIPWAMKFLWAPLIDILKRRWPLKRWILVSQLFMGLALTPLLIFDLHASFPLISIFLILHSFAAATQDVSIDALCISVTTQKERGTLNGWMQTGMLTTRAALGGGALIMLTSLGMSAVVFVLIGVVWSSSLLLLLTRVEETLSGAQQGAKRFLEILSLAARKRSTWLGLIFAAVGGAGYEAVGAVAGPFLIDQGLSSESVGWFFLLPAVLATMAGSLTGGILADKIDRIKAVRAFLLLMVGAVFLISGLDRSGIEVQEWYLPAFSILYFSIGLFTSSTYALFMDLTHPDLGATQFSAYMGATNLCESGSSFSIGRIAGGWGYAVGFAVMGCVSLTTLFVLRKIRREDMFLFEPVQQ